MPEKRLQRTREAYKPECPHSYNIMDQNTGDYICILCGDRLLVKTVQNDRNPSR